MELDRDSLQKKVHARYAREHAELGLRGTLARLLEDAAVVSTAYPFHHGIGYGEAPEAAYDHDAAGLAHAKTVIESGISLLEQGDYWGYNQHCVEAKSDTRDTGQVYRYLRGPMSGAVLDISYTDSSALYDQPKPTWVAGALIEWTLNQ